MVPRLFPTMTSGVPSPLASEATICVPMPELSSIYIRPERRQDAVVATEDPLAAP